MSSVLYRCWTKTSSRSQLCGSRGRNRPRSSTSTLAPDPASCKATPPPPTPEPMMTTSAGSWVMVAGMVSGNPLFGLRGETDQPAQGDQEVGALERIEPDIGLQAQGELLTAKIEKRQRIGAGGLDLFHLRLNGGLQRAWQRVRPDQRDRLGAGGGHEGAADGA